MIKRHDIQLSIVKDWLLKTLITYKLLVRPRPIFMSSKNLQLTVEKCYAIGCSNKVTILNQSLECISYTSETKYELLIRNPILRPRLKS